MSLPKSPPPSQLVVSILSADGGLIDGVIDELSRLFGRPCLVSDLFAFTFTDYYDDELGTPIRRRIAAFDHRLTEDGLVDVKLATNAIEARHSINGRRRVNIDPGALNLTRFVLASCKNFSHRIHLGSGVYADLTLVVRDGVFTTLPWTYPDYASEPIVGILWRLREQMKRDARSAA